MPTRSAGLHHQPEDHDHARRNQFRKDKAEHFLDCLANGKPIEDVRTFDDFLALAGACYFAAMSHGPVRLRDDDWSKLPLERREAASETFTADLLAAVEFYGQLTMMVKDGKYDENCEPNARAIIYTRDDKRSFMPLEGFRTQDEQ